MKKLILLFAITISVYGQSFLRTEGQKIVDESGNNFQFKGMGLGGWLVPEGYMLNMASFANSPTEIKNKIVDLVGIDNANEFFKEYRKNFVSKEDIDSLAAWGFNSVRLPMHYELMTPRDQPFTYIEEGFAYIDSLLKWCRPHNIYVILDLHCAPGGQSDEPISDYDANYPSLWESDQNKLRTIDLWRHIAQRYKDEPLIGGYDLLNEPKWDLPPNNQPLRNLYIDITKAIREADSNHIVFAEGNWFATDMTGLTPPWDFNMAYSFHKYWSEVSRGSIQSYLTIRNNYNVPLWMSESGENSNNWFKEFISLLNDNNIGWHWWTLKKFESISALESTTISPQFRQLLNYWNGSAARPSVDFAKTALALQAENLKTKNNTIKTGVINAMTKLPYEDINTPFKNNVIPGRLFFTEYDYGSNGIAYYDKTYQNTGGGVYNSGWSFRNDGVDIEHCSDQYSNGYNVGWIESGDWLKFTVNINEAGRYDASFRVAANESGGKIQIYLDDTVVSSLIDVPITGGWQNWQTMVVHDIDLPEGKHEITFRFFFGGFNVNYVDFNLIQVGVEESTSAAPVFYLGQNSPNPIHTNDGNNAETNISLMLPETDEVKLTIYDMLGREVKTIVKGKLESGKHNFKFSLRNLNLPSGVYFYNLTSGKYSATKKMLLLK